MPPHNETEEQQPKIVRKLILVYPVNIQDLSGCKRHRQGYEEVKSSLTDIIDLRRFKEVVVSYGLHSPYIKQILNS